MSNDTERLLCGNCKYHFKIPSDDGCLGICAHPQLDPLLRLCGELGCDGWTPSNATEEAQETEALKRLEAAAHAMAAAVEALELLGTPEARKHAEEMYGAVKMIEQWVIEIKAA